MSTKPPPSTSLPIPIPLPPVSPSPATCAAAITSYNKNVIAMLKQIHNPYKCSSQKLRTLHALRTTLNLDMLFNMSTLQYADGKRLVAETEGARADMAPGTYEETVGALEKDLVVLAGIIGKVTAFGEGFGVMERRLRGEISSGCGGDSHDENEKEEVKAREVSVKDLKSLLRLVDKIMESQV